MAPFLALHLLRVNRETGNALVLIRLRGARRIVYEFTVGGDGRAGALSF